MAIRDEPAAGLLAGLLPAVQSALSSALGSAAPGFPDAGGGPPLTLGAPDGAKAPLIVALAERAPGAVLVATARADQARDLWEDVQGWLPAARAEPVLLFPPREGLPYERHPHDRDAVQARIHALATLARGGRPLLLTDAQALSQRTLSQRPSLSLLRVGGHIDVGRFLATLDAAGYHAVAATDEAGTVARRGGIIDVYPLTGDPPVRIELVGDAIESLRRFDPATQRSTREITECDLGVATEAQIDADAIALASSLDLRGLRGSGATAFTADLAQIQEGTLPADLAFWTPFLARGALCDHLPPGTLIIRDEPDEIRLQLQEIHEQAAEVRADCEARGEIPLGLPLPGRDPSDTLAAVERWRPRIDLHRFATDNRLEGTTRRLAFTSVDSYGGRLGTLLNDIARARQDRQRTVLVSLQAPRLAELFTESGVAVAATPAVPDAPPAGTITLVHGSAASGWRLPDYESSTLLLTDREIFGFAKQRRARLRRVRKHQTFLEDLQSGDYVVHVEHGIGRFAGTTQETVGDRVREYLELRYADNDRLLVPTDQLHRVQRYVGPGAASPALTRLGTQQWQRAKQRVRAAVRALAEDLIALYASRRVLPGTAALPDTPWQMELEAAFPYLETPDQAQAIREVKVEMERPRPMDRIIVGDVGYGKTEIAIRAAFKTVMSSRQVAMLVPTTVLAQQHDRTFRERMAPFPVRIEMLSRFRSPAEQQRILTDLRSGQIDIVIGTHRLLQQDVALKALGLVIIDEEQRFGVAAKERLKQLRREVDVLTLSATPIPRTLHMVLTGIRDMSTIETPPEERQPIVTYVMETDDQVVREAILREIERGGQIYVVHNRVQSIDLIARWLRDLVPEARFLVAHGQLPEDTLARVMTQFIAREAHVLICTTIIESGLDIPNVNTIIIHQAHRLGLAQLYQLRGRVGRGVARAHAYLLYNRNQPLTEPAQQRLQTIFDATELGAGFQIAMKDLEIRGAGNLLGAEQSGHIGAVGFELYTQLLAEAVEHLRAQQEDRPPALQRQGPTVSLDLPLAAHLPEAYINHVNLRLAAYQQLAAIEDGDGVERIAQDLRDRFGPPPAAVQNLLAVVRLRVLAARLGAQSLAREEEDIVLRLTPGLTFDPLLRRDGFPDGVSLGRSLLRFDLRTLRGDWLPLVESVLERLASAPAAVATPT